ncbi:MAG: DUF6510 family protein [Actinomycetota bacterium]|nr:DUF6510 family protein [Actinomycetota bacterium]
MTERPDDPERDSSERDSSERDSSALDGNAIGGLLIEVFGGEMTTATGICGTCGAASEVAEFAVYLRGPGTVVRCRGCESVLMVFVRVRGITCVDLQGLASLTSPRPIR